MCNRVQLVDFWQGFPRGAKTNFDPATCFLLCALLPPFPSPPENLLAVVIYPLRIFRSYTNDLWPLVSANSRAIRAFYTISIYPLATTPSNRKTAGPEVARLLKMVGRGSHALLIALKAIHHPYVSPFSSFREEDLYGSAYTRSFFRYRCLSARMKIVNGIIFIKDESENQSSLRIIRPEVFTTKSFLWIIIAIKNNRARPIKNTLQFEGFQLGGCYECRS